MTHKPMILSVGQCGYDDSQLAHVAKLAGFQLDRALSAEDATSKLTTHHYALALINRIFDSDGDSGLALITALRQQNIPTPLMLVSDHPDAQALLADQRQ